MLQARPRTTEKRDSHPRTPCPLRVSPWCTLWSGGPRLVPATRRFPYRIAAARCGVKDDCDARRGQSYYHERQNLATLVASRSSLKRVLAFILAFFLFSRARVSSLAGGSHRDA
ncbi:hypothetical protein MRX96_046040 [Rhipicephalus microplus]